MEEIWKDINRYEGLYQVSNFGRMRSLGNGNSNNSKVRILKVSKNRCGYLCVCLCKDGKQKTFKLHRLVAETFLPNPLNLPQVNHKDEDKTNNFVGTPENDYKDGNLEWCDNKYNSNYGTRNKRISKSQSGVLNTKKSKPVLQYSLDGTFIREYPSASECGRNGFNQGLVSTCCRGECSQAYGFIWKYKE